MSCRLGFRILSRRFPLNSSNLLLCRFFFSGTSTTEIYTLSLHDALPILGFEGVAEVGAGAFFLAEGLDEVGDLVDEGVFVADLQAGDPPVFHVGMVAVGDVDAAPAADRSEEHTSELQSRLHLVCRLLLEK